MNQKFYNILTNTFDFIFQDQKILLAVSGGADSTFMAHMFAQVKDLNIYMLIQY